MSAKTIPDLALALDKAESAFRRAGNEADRARAVETAALNDLNAAQRALDDALADRRKTAPPASGWHRSRLLPVEVGS